MSRAAKSKDYIIHSVEDIRKLPNLQTGCELLRKYGLDARGLKDKDEAIDRLLQNMDAILNITGNEKPRPQSQRTFDDVLGEDEVNRRELGQHLVECAKYFNDLPAQFRNDLEDIFPNYFSIPKDRLNDLERNQCSILVADLMLRIIRKGTESFQQKRFSKCSIL